MIIIIDPLTYWVKMKVEIQSAFIKPANRDLENITDGGSFTDTGVQERGENERKSENESEMRNVN